MTSIDPDALAQSFLRAMKERGASALVVYASRGRSGQPVMRISANTDKKTAQGVVSWMSGMDERAVEAAAQEIQAATTPGSWDDVSDDVKDSIRAAVRKAFQAARETVGRTVNIQTEES